MTTDITLTTEAKIAIAAMAAGDWRSSKVFLETYVHPRINAGRLVADRMNLNSISEL